MKKIKEFFKDIDKQRLIGMLCVLCALFILGFTLRSCMANDDEEKKEFETEKETESIAYDLYDVPTDEALAKMNLEIEMPEEIEEKIPSMDTFKKQFENYLIEEDFWNDVTRATSDYIVTENFNKNTISMDFTLNDKTSTTIIVLIDKNSGNITFNYY